MDQWTERAMEQYRAQVAQITDPQPYRDAETGAVCTCGRVIGLEAPRGFAGASIPHADDCPVRVARQERNDIAAAERAEREHREARAARAAREKRQSTCLHSWYMLSHEERKCRNCGLVDFVPDWD